jgi:hypothetical protein
MSNHYPHAGRWPLVIETRQTEKAAIAEMTSDPRQPNRFEKNKNTIAFQHPSRAPSLQCLRSPQQELMQIPTMYKFGRPHPMMVTPVIPSASRPAAASNAANLVGLSARKVPSPGFLESARTTNAI